MQPISAKGEDHGGICICGKIRCGKTYLAHRLVREYNVALLPCDGISLWPFSEGLDEAHDEMMQRVQKYLHTKVIKIVRTGTTVVLDRQVRQETTAFYAGYGIRCKGLYADVSDEQWQINIEKRNHAVFYEESHDYYVDERLMNKLFARFELPDKNELRLYESFSLYDLTNRRILL